MKKIIKTQEELDKLQRIEKGEEVIIKVSLRLNCILDVLGILKIQAGLDCNRWEGRYIKARDSSSVEAWGNSSVEAWGQALVRTTSTSIKLSLHGFSILSLPFHLMLKFKKEKTCIVQKYKHLPYIEREGVLVKKDNMILFKKVSYDYKTQERTKNETLWTIGAMVTHPAWSPRNSECGEGKFHACSRPYFCDEFRNEKGDIYVAIEVATKDLYEWPKPVYPHKIAFREGKVLYKVDKFGKEIAE